MNVFTKSLAILSAVFLLSACDSTSNSSTSGKDGKGGVAGGPARPGSAEDLTQNVGDRVFFALDSSTLSTEAQHSLDKQAAWLKQYPNVRVQIEGNADERGTREYNIALGQRRADSVKTYLSSLGVSTGRIDTSPMARIARSIPAMATMPGTRTATPTPTWCRMA